MTSLQVFVGVMRLSSGVCPPVCPTASVWPEPPVVACEAGSVEPADVSTSTINAIATRWAHQRHVCIH